MQKTFRDLEVAWADHIGGIRGKRMRAALQKPSPLDALFDRPMSDAAFAVELRRIQSLPRDVARLHPLQGDVWGGPN